MSYQQHVAPRLLRGLERALRDEEVPDEELLAGLLHRVVQLLAADVRLVPGLDVVPGRDQLPRRHPARHLVLVPGQPLKQSRLYVDL